jgi:SRSO17 transposase
MIHVKDEEALPTKHYHLPVCDNPLTDEKKYFLSNAPANTPRKKLLQVAFSRWPIERRFEDQKGEVGLSHWEGRTWMGLQRHLVLSSVSHFFLAPACKK